MKQFIGQMWLLRRIPLLRERHPDASVKTMTMMKMTNGMCHPPVVIIHSLRGFHFSEDDRKRALVKNDSMEIDPNAMET